MSRENVELVLDMFRAFSERDDEALFASYAPDVEWDLRDYSPWMDEPRFRGHDGIRQFFRKWLENFQDYEAQALDPVDAGEEVVITVLDRATGKGSGAAIERVHGEIWTVCDGLVVRIQIFDSRAEAMKAVGLG
jgi:ketosteroid isomerase-like protein